jgi:hypothetical protein
MVCVGNAAACTLVAQYPQFPSEIKPYLIIFEPDVEHVWDKFDIHGSVHRSKTQ